MALPHSYGSDPLEVGATFTISFHNGKGHVLSTVSTSQIDVRVREYYENDKFQ
jgi:hypothetical protein